MDVRNCVSAINRLDRATDHPTPHSAVLKHEALPRIPLYAFVLGVYAESQLHMYWHFQCNLNLNLTKTDFFNIL